MRAFSSWPHPGLGRDGHAAVVGFLGRALVVLLLALAAAFAGWLTSGGLPEDPVPLEPIVVEGPAPSPTPPGAGGE